MRTLSPVQPLASTATELIEQYIPLALSIARRMCHRPSELSDVEQIAMVGLVKAGKGFDESFGVAFSTYAWRTIEGEVKRYFRDHTWMVHVTRSLQERSLRINSVIDLLTQDLHRAPTLEEIAYEEKCPVEDVIEALEVQQSRYSSLIDTVDGDDFHASLGQEDMDITLISERAPLQRMLERLPERQQTVVYLRFFEQLSQSEIAARIGTSQMQVSRLLARSFALMRNVASEDDLRETGVSS